ncbi:MAG TPA: hypothetical protein VE422_05685 [Terriglobia bacterium]|nr:hypothetical protein [Terriglobia bacterium]
MKRIVLVILALLLTLVQIGCQKETAQTRTDVINEAYPEDQAKIRRMFGDLLEVAKKGDIDRVEAFHLYGPKFTKYDETEPNVRLDAEAARKLERDFVKPGSEIDASFQDLKVDVFGDVGGCHGHSRLSGSNRESRRGGSRPHDDGVSEGWR